MSNDVGDVDQEHSLATKGCERSIGVGPTLAYGMGSFGTGIFSTVPSVLLLFFCTETLGLAPAAVAVILLLPKIWSIFWDPFIGAWSDSCRSQWGRRRPFMLVGAIGTGAAFATLFAPPKLSLAETTLWVAGSYFALTIFYSTFAVPYTAIPSEIGKDAVMTARLVGTRMMVVMGGILTGAAAAPVIVATAGGGRGGYASMGLALGAICVTAMIAPIIMLGKHDTRTALTSRSPGFETLIKGLLNVVRNRAYRALLLAFLAQAAAYGGMSAAFPYLIKQNFGRGEADTGIAFGVLLIASFASMPLWSWLARRIGAISGIVIAAIGYALITLVIAVLAWFRAEWTLALLCMAVAGVPFAGLQLLPFMAASEIVRLTAPSEEAIFAGAWTATEKIGLASGAAILALILGNRSVGGNAAALFVSIVPSTLTIMSLWSLRSISVTGAPPSAPPPTEIP